MASNPHVYNVEAFLAHVREFIAEKGDVNGTFYNSPYFNPKPLHYAIERKCAPAVKLLLEAGADPNKTAEGGLTPLRRCLRLPTDQSILQIVSLLLDHGADLLEVDHKGRTAIHSAFIVRKSAIVELLLKRLPIGENPVDVNRLSTFHIACAHGVDKVVRELLDNGVGINDSIYDPELRLRFNGLQFAILDNRKSTVELLLERGANIDYPYTYGRQLLHLACECNPEKFSVNYDGKVEVTRDAQESNRQNQLDIIDLLLSRGIDINTKRHEDRIPPLITTCMGRCINISSVRNPMTCPSNHVKVRQRQIVRHLIARGAKLDIGDETSSKKSFLHVLFSRHLNKVEEEPIDPEIMKILIENGVDINARDAKQYTPLHSIILHPAYLHPVKADYLTRHIELLLNHGADINARNVDGLTPIRLLFDTYTFPPQYRRNIWLYQSRSMRALLVHAQRLVTLGMPVDQDIKDCLTNKQVFGDFTSVEKDCEQELELMKEVQVDDQTSLFHLLQTGLDGESQHVPEAKLRMIMKKFKVAQKYPNYAAIFETRIRRKQFRRLAESTLFMIAGGEMPYLCADTLFNYLTNFEIKNLGDARNAKRVPEEPAEEQPTEKRTRT